MKTKRMDAMDEVANKIRASIKSCGYNRNDVSVRQNQNFTIHVKTLSIQAIKNRAEVLKIVEQCYYEKPHSWLCVMVDNQWITMNKKDGKK